MDNQLNQEQSYLLYLMINDAVDPSTLDQLLQEVGFELTSQKGEGLGSFRNYHHQLQSDFGVAQLHFTLPPNQATVKTVSLSLSTEDQRAIIALVFEKLAVLKEKLSFDLLDSELKTQYLILLKEEGKVNDYLIGLTPEESKMLDARCFLEFDAATFWKNEMNLEKRDCFVHTK